MKTRSINQFLLAFAFGLLCMAPVWSDDTEIFFGDVQNPDSLPNVLFVIDTSGSMGWPAEGSDKNRLDNVKDAMYTLLDELNNVNIGLMRFTDPGGPVLYPVKYIDGDLNSGEIVAVEAGIGQDSDDAQEAASTGQVTIDGDVLEMVTISVGGQLEDVDYRLNDDDDDAVEWLDDDGRVQNDWLDLYLGYGNDAVNGVRFTGTEIPPGATVTNAYIRFTAYTPNDGRFRQPVTVTIVGEEDDSGTFDEGDRYNISERDYTAAAVEWQIEELATSELVDTPNIASIVQEIIDDPDWDAPGEENDMVFILAPSQNHSGNGRRRFDTRDYSYWRSARLFVEYYTGSGPSNDRSRVGLRFSDVRVPRGATVTSAQLTFTAERDTETTFDLQIAAEDSGTAQTFSATSNDISGRTLTTARVGWSGSADLNARETFSSPDIANIVQEVVSRDDWCGRNQMAFVVSGTAGYLRVFSREGDVSESARLTVNYEYDSIPAGSSCFVASQTRSISQSSEDAEEDTDDGDVFTSSDNLDMEDDRVIGLRFNDIDVPRGAQVQQAYLEFTARLDDGGDVDWRIYAQASDDAATYNNSDENITDRNYSGATVDWEISEDWDDDSVYRSPDISSLIESVTSRGGWETGNSWVAPRICWTPHWSVK